jgi:hypothetical protein|tara:strand:+ start:752 stop:1117 length:366 start_codon:yes stop_codon:yes gene_type:complete
MQMFQWFQCGKDFLAIPVFILLAIYQHDRQLLSVFFAFGSLLDACYGLYAEFTGHPWTIARVKDALGAHCMCGFSVLLLWATPAKDPGRWPYFFWFAAVVDSVSVLSIARTKNIYSTTLST